MQLLVISFFFNQLLVSTTLHNLTLMQYTDFIGMLDGAQSVSTATVVRVFISFSKAS